MENHPVRVLLVDDEKRFRETAAGFLAKRGFAVEPAAGGEEALQKIQNQKFHVVVLDLRMPGMTGQEALTKLKESNPDIAVIILSGHGTPESIHQGLEQGVYDYLAKPCSLHLLAKKIQEAASIKENVAADEPLVKDVMTPLSAFASLYEDQPVGDLLEIIFQEQLGQDAYGEIKRKAFLVTDSESRVTGVVGMFDVLEGLAPSELRVNSVWRGDELRKHLAPAGKRGAFTVMVRYLAATQVKDLLKNAADTIHPDATLEEAANQMLYLKLRRLLVMNGEKAVGVIREEDLFREMSRII